MAMEFQINKNYNFNTLAPVLLGQNFVNMKVLAIINSEAAVMYRDIQTLHVNVSSVIPNIPKSVYDLSYILFQNEQGEKTLLAYEYIDTNTIVEVQSVNIRVEIRNVNTEDVQIIRNALTELGYRGADIQTYR